MGNLNVVRVALPMMHDELALRIYKTGRTFGTTPAPVVVLCHGFCGVQDLLLPEIAGAFALSGYTAVTFDYRGFGGSSGERGRLTISQQQADIRAVLHWVSQNPDMDRNRIGLWGTSLGGCHVVCVAANNPLVKCVISQMPFADGFTTLTSRMDEGEVQHFIHTLNAMDERRRIVGNELWVSPSRILKDEGSKEFFRRHKHNFPDIETKIPVLTIKEILNVKPVLFAGNVEQPTLITLAESDVVNPSEQGWELFNSLGGLKSLHIIPEAGHYDLYESPFQNEALNEQIGWLNKHL
ncbi:alpha/beta fold hydrolase [Enterobacter sp. WCHEn045836]|uniref:alpha/beta hydrolase n=1 Tax=Enterobacter sp. WCHEn045836 TaxID=2497434 RepID=UPI000F81A334|nr:alpha/beta fold hydrolase [Enterobacter sp. WCHEn045836]RTP97272.1 alpha/beta fold hydrolase [Enterobacter sp. WCHEn045836]